PRTWRWPPPWPRTASASSPPGATMTAISVASRPAPPVPTRLVCRKARSVSSEPGRGWHTAPVERVPYDEFAYFADNAAEAGLPYPGPPTVERTSVEVRPGFQLSALVWGTSRPQLVFLHGGAQNAHTWDTVALALDRPLVAVDLPGHGHSDGGDHSVLDVDDNARDVATAVRELAPDADAVVGMSLGGLTTVALAGVAPELVRRVVLVDVLPAMVPEKAKMI